MDWRLLLLLAGILMSLAIYVYRARPANEVNQRFAVQTLTLALWIIGIAGTHSAHAPEIWGRWTFASASLLPAVCLAFAHVFPEPDRWPSALVVRCFMTLGIALSLVSVATPLIAYDFVIINDGTLRRRPGLLFPIFGCYFIIGAAAN